MATDQIGWQEDPAILTDKQIRAAKIKDLAKLVNMKEFFENHVKDLVPKEMGWTDWERKMNLLDSKIDQLVDTVKQ